MRGGVRENRKRGRGDASQRWIEYRFARIQVMLDVRGRRNLTGRIRIWLGQSPWRIPLVWTMKELRISKKSKSIFESQSGGEFLCGAEERGCMSDKGSGDRADGSPGNIMSSWGLKGECKGL